MKLVHKEKLLTFEGLKQSHLGQNGGKRNHNIYN